jgi:hypothetical protein
VSDTTRAGHGAWLLGLLAVLLVAVLVLPLPSMHTIVWAAIENSAHAPIFGAVALLAERSLRRWRRAADSALVRYVAAFTIAISIGFGTELLQFFGPRDASFGDAVTNSIGAAGALAAHASMRVVRRPAYRAALAGVAIACVLVVIAPIALALAATIQRDREFPVLANYDSRLDLELISTRSARVSRTGWPRWTTSASEGPALRVDFASRGRSGVVFEEPVSDWSGYRELVLDIANPAGQPLGLRVLVDDAWHDRRGTDRYMSVVSIAPGTRERVRIPLEDIRHGPPDRMLDLAHISSIMLFRADGDPATHCYLGPIRLE